jgi:glycosyltransferase involved in cell wall biosynthesis
MFGWEFPPFFAGGVGMVCYELTKQLSSLGVSIDYVMPFAPDNLKPHFLSVLDASRFVSHAEAQQHTHLNVTSVKSLLAAYQTQEEYEETLRSLSYSSTPGTPKHAIRDNTKKLYGENLLEEINLFAQRVAVMVEQGIFKDFSVIHAHDWTTVPAAAVVKRMTGKPLIVHVHITEFNKNGGLGADPTIYDVERQGFFAADKIVTVSHGIKQTLVEQYGVPAEKITVIHNGNVQMNPVVHDGAAFKGNDQVVSYLGRVTGMKGPENFVDMAIQVLQHRPNTKFVMGGTGDKLQACIDKTKAAGVYDRFYFHGFYTRQDADFFYDISDVFVLPSVMEPFGVTPLEAMIKDTPTIVTKQSGVSEVLKHVFKVDFWDVSKMAAQVVNLLTYPILHKTMQQNGRQEAQKLDWKKPAQECLQLYYEVSK